MNKKELEIQRKKTLNKYGIQGGNYYSRRAKNAIYFNPSNSLQHELKKAEICFQLLEKKKQFITEAWNRKLGLRRDIVVLDDDSIIEVETDRKRAERFKDDYEADKIEVIELWKVNQKGKAF